MLAGSGAAEKFQPPECKAGFLSPLRMVSSSRIWPLFTPEFKESSTCLTHRFSVVKDEINSVSSPELNSM